MLCYCTKIKLGLGGIVTGKQRKKQSCVGIGKNLKCKPNNMKFTIENPKGKPNKTIGLPGIFPF